MNLKGDDAAIILRVERGQLSAEAYMEDYEDHDLASGAKVIATLIAILLQIGDRDFDRLLERKMKEYLINGD